MHWSRRRDSNPEPAVYKTAALPIELRRRDAQGHTADAPRRRGMIGPGARDGSSVAAGGRVSRRPGGASTTCAPAGRVGHRSAGARHPRARSSVPGSTSGTSGDGSVASSGGFVASSGGFAARRDRRARAGSGAAGSGAAGSSGAASGGPGSSAAGGSGTPGVAVGVPLGQRLEQEDRPCHRRIQRADDALHRDAHEQVAPSSDGRSEPLTLTADDDGERPAQVALARGQGCIAVRPRDPDPATAQIAQGGRQILDGAQQEMLDRTRPTPSRPTDSAAPGDGSGR